ncbi:hypothetical protein BCR32DRAFT_274289 [Anaeromyces robustus]|uniref:Uncharacterized protein n=1 Tax=Anaeromyces robustus TaxID=1754192 RepID=A0A1Y1XPK2_9FUNG|nr:hypothetical protein BCR32DRAFT_274289 [Anaeromyces robustus]|eukprot:ORX87678.1 hypothetical protein BCR32DRAFT_274289 [Anaeromyces robustus]
MIYKLCALKKIIFLPIGVINLKFLLVVIRQGIYFETDAYANTSNDCYLELSYVKSRFYSSTELAFVEECRSFDKVINEFFRAAYRSVQILTLRTKKGLEHSMKKVFSPSLVTTFSMNDV